MDRLSVLPKETIDSILTFLPFLEVVRTSILSRSWRYQWHSLSKLSIYHDLSKRSAAAFVKIVDHILLVHCGPIDMFRLCDLPACNDIDRWILYLSRNGIKELIVKFFSMDYDFPSCLFSCCDLTYLELSRCKLEPPAALVKAFSNLTGIYLDCVEITGQGLENLLNSCPLLKKLTLLELITLLDDFYWPSLNINAPNLVSLQIREVYCYFHIKYAPFLTSASFDIEVRGISKYEEADECKIVELLGLMPILQRLEFKNNALQYLAVGDAPAHLPFTYPIKYLEMELNFDDLQEMQAAFCIIRSSPAIEHLVLMLYAGMSGVRTNTSICGFWKGEEDLNFSLDHLQKVAVTVFYGTKDQLKFIKYLLGNAPALVTMEINLCEATVAAQYLFTVVTELTRFPRISPRAELITNLNEQDMKDLSWSIIHEEASD